MAEFFTIDIQLAVN